MPPRKSKKQSQPAGLSYAQAGVNIAAADDTKDEIARTLHTRDPRLLNAVGSWAFAALYDGRFPGFKHPVLVLKTEEPGSKQLLAFKHDRVESICQDTIHHLINDIAVMGATPYSVQDCVVCGKLEKTIVTRIVAAMAAACRAHGCTLTGGETSEQPGTLAPGAYVLTASIIGVVERAHILDGSAIRAGDRVLAVPSNGLHTNGYSLVRALLKKKPALAKQNVAGERFLDVILKPHLCYYNAIKDLFPGAGKGKIPGVTGIAHITGSGIAGNLDRILPKHLDARVNLADLRILPIFHAIRAAGRVADAEMLRTYNMGVGLTIVAKPAAVAAITTHLAKHGHHAYDIGEIIPGRRQVQLTGKLPW